MGYISHFYITALLFLALSCGSSKEKATANKSVDTTQQKAAIYQDTITVKDTIPDMPPPPDPAPAPGTVRLLGEMLTVHPQENSSGGTIEFKILEVLGYGSSTPPIATQDTLKLKITSSPDSIKEGEQYIIGLKHQQTLKLGNDNEDDKTTGWRLIGIKPAQKEMNN